MPPITLDGTRGITTPTYNGSTTAEYLVPVTGFKNRIINGDMSINQRGSSTTSNGYALDRWVVTAITGSKMTVAQSSDAPTGFSNSMLITSSAATTIASGDYYDIGQRIEGFNTSDLMFGTANAQTITISFWAKSSLTGTFGGSLMNSSQNRSYPFTFTINSANTWEYETITIRGDTGGTWIGATNGTGMQVLFGLGVGTTYQATAGAWVTGYFYPTGAVNLLATNAATLQITGVQLEKGSNATSFDYLPYGTELALCQRYYYGYVSGGGKLVGRGGYYSGTQVEAAIFFPVTMRTMPTLVATSGSNFYVAYRNGGGDDLNSLTLSSEGSAASVSVFNNSEASGTGGDAAQIATNNSSASVAFSAEL